MINHVLCVRLETPLTHLHTSVGLRTVRWRRRCTRLLVGTIRAITSRITRIRCRPGDSTHKDCVSATEVTVLGISFRTTFVVVASRAVLNGDDYTSTTSICMIPNIFIVTAWNIKIDKNTHWSRCLRDRLLKNRKSDFDPMKISDCIHRKEYKLLTMQ